MNGESHPHLQENLEAHYILGDIIARGQFSTVYKCLYKGKIERACRTYDKSDDGTIGLKTLCKDNKGEIFIKGVIAVFCTKQSNVNLAKVEDQLEKILKTVHPNLIQILEGFQSKEEIHFITERVYGEELFERIVELGHYSEREAASLISDILSALVCLHTNGVIHGDIRPESLIYSSTRPDAVLKLRDVSFSRWTPNTHSSVYIAPEKGEKPTMAGDMWSLGIVLYIMLCGIEPGAGEIFTELLPGLTLPWWEDISQQAKEVVQKLLEIDPEQRLTAQEAQQVPWVQGKVAREQHLESAVERLREFNAKAKFRVASKAVLATRKMSLPFQKRMELR